MIQAQWKMLAGAKMSNVLKTTLKGEQHFIWFVFCYS